MKRWNDVGSARGKERRQTYHQPGSCVSRELYIPYRSKRSREGGTKLHSVFLRRGKGTGVLAISECKASMHASAHPHVLSCGFCVCPLVKIQSGSLTFSPGFPFIRPCVRVRSVLTSPLPPRQSTQGRIVDSARPVPRHIVVRSRTVYAEKYTQNSLSCM